MTLKTSPLILVIGGTGTQGGNVARELLKNGHRVRILTRNPESITAKQMAEAGAEVVKGDMGNLQSLEPAMQGVTAIFSAQYADPNDPSIELRNASNMVQMAQKTGIQQIVHTSVVGSNVFPRWDKYKALVETFDHKYEVEEYIEYTALRSPDNEYLGIIEVTQDITNLRELKDDQRLLSYSSK
ncbi:uncharacterized protein YbjT (DUF2867 family) [Parabacteroides sp. PF5-5]|uniref:NmrA family NAD(P)-binding protein n=1 Tax=unclassified Parabacteroides TaxID=2649774 RepID=UPI002475E53F|nr:MULTISPECIES: NmrA family NAD(P)-binding protein [unclassified Parabacteroides]MDH6304000.1 uncharacterized protein YbjT (DUF2867 family) [Parabacteroides sp. PH5-39]MDH6315285.1 uncharacterized protein YbjT (DUF2867 family) [Parabacteroides sp. PF5-13]MDH6318945.1 uncharacterized protein YbjT (DUF2867 family) [Parabacteroides sp. PH5-13]MDH6322674.1 uncharacterized protein YbjT (DUF2867 family) [Parabacteroides sp. PH5-8]MDH6326189.1 uncharacterized protein YbjT (DUF2867 family) [Parabacte